ncbi:hypothetical protein C8A01DRAFT_19868 [Parachaetomium inaequale]|uniref:Uncharacterized protein n=1 Tax=Parachaetomium inaequale TaxID=2588326 RepID=A0AAN6P7H0_9PEZI|nr:hypothetical protein C8A01DRAFT_19868 [Parachaetomium inaequale]
MPDATVGGGADPAPRDFAPIPPRTTLPPPTAQHSENPGGGSSQESSHVHYAPNDPGLASTTRSGLAPNPANLKPSALARSDTEAALSPGIRRRPTRAGTFKTVDDFDDFTVRPGWHPGAEPGVDPTKPDGGHASMPTLSAPCKITVVDFSQDHLSLQRLDNETLAAFLGRPRPDWAGCRWINVNGLSWDVIQALGRHKNLHRLAIEDIMNTRNRTKAEWFPTHAFIVLTLQKLVHVYDSESEDSDSDPEDDARSRRSVLSKRSARSPRRLLRRLRRAFRDRPGDKREKGMGTGKTPILGDAGVYLRSQPTGFSDMPDISQLRTLQHYHASPNDPRTQYMEKHSALSSKNLAVACEQVSIFLTNDNCIISFFEQSAQDIEAPIIRRLQTNDTIIRQSCDASMVGQAIMDGIIDLAIPVTACYGDVIGDLELDVLNRPNIGHTKSLYILISEINKILSFISPITTLINALRDHEANVAPDAVMAHLLDPSHGVIVTPMTYTYLGDVLDHCMLITETLNQLKGSAEGMIGLIFNTISAYQNESMRQLTTATIIFLPLTFITGYFGQNFVPFNVLNEDVGYFWKIAVPVVAVTIIALLWEGIYDYFRALLQRRYILRLKKNRSRRRNRPPA